MKSPTISQLLQTIDAYNKAHELHLKYPPEVRTQANPLLQNLYAAAAEAAEALRPLLKVELKTVARKTP